MSHVTYTAQCRVVRARQCRLDYVTDSKLCRYIAWCQVAIPKTTAGYRYALEKLRAIQVDRLAELTKQQTAAVEHGNSSWRLETGDAHTRKHTMIDHPTNTVKRNREIALAHPLLAFYLTPASKLQQETAAAHPNSSAFSRPSPTTASSRDCRRSSSDIALSRSSPMSSTRR